MFWDVGCARVLFPDERDLTSADIVELMREPSCFIRDFEGEVPGVAAKDCGNYLLHKPADGKIRGGKIPDRGTGRDGGEKFDIPGRMKIGIFLFWSPC